MTQEAVDKNISATPGNFSFDGDTPKFFDEHVRKSVPVYNSSHDLTVKFSDYFVKNDSVIYDIGSSTGTLISNLAKRHAHRDNIQIIGVDAVQEMVDFASHSVGAHDHRIEFRKMSVEDCCFETTDLVTSLYALQFVLPKYRQEVVNAIYQALNWGGAFIWYEKVRCNDARFQDYFTTLYDEFKSDQGFTHSEIVAKTRSLKGVMEPFSSSENVRILQRAGFEDFISIQKYLNFEGWLAIK